MKHETEEKVWKFTCVVNKVQCEAYLLLCTRLIIIPILTTPTWEHLELQNQYCLSSAHQMVCIAFHAWYPILYGPMGKNLAEWGLKIGVAKILHLFWSTTLENAHLALHE